MNRPLTYLEFKPNQIFYINGFDTDTIKDYLLPQSDARGYYGLFHAFDFVFKKTTAIPDSDRFFYPIIVSLRKIEHQIDKINIPPLVIEKIRSGQAKILIVCPYEGWEWSYWAGLANTLKSKYNLVDSSFVMLTGNYYPNTQHTSVIYNHWENITNDTMGIEQRQSVGVESLSKIRKNKFICLNRRPTAARYAIVSLLYDFKDQGILTCAKYAGYNDDYVGNQYRDFSRYFPEMTEDFSKRISSSIPLTFEDGIDPEVENPAYDHSKDKFYDSYLYIVTETWFLEKETLFLSEKTFKPITFLQPFVIIGRPGTLKLLKSLGYKTFHEYWDESYDDEVDDNRRLYKAVDAIKSIIKKSPQELTDMMINMQDVLKHNFDTLKYRKSIQLENLRDDLYKALG